MTDVPPILHFKDEFGFLSNFYPCVVRLNGDRYKSVEHAFQAAKTLVPERRLLIACAPTPRDAKRMGRDVQLRSDWELIKLPVMRNLVAQKFREPSLRERLVATWPRRMLEANTWNDVFWGVDAKTLQGGNHLGNILHNVREDILLEESSLDFERQRSEE